MTFLKYLVFCKIVIILQSPISVKALSLLQPFSIGREIEFVRLDGMCRGHKVPITVNYKGLKQNGNVFFLNSTLISKEDIAGEPIETISIVRCASRENLDSCQNYKELKINYCDMSKITLHYSYVPEWKCPLKKGTYNAVNSKLDLSSVSILSQEKWFWKVDVKLHDKNNRLLFCTKVEIITRAKL